MLPSIKIKRNSVAQNNTNRSNMQELTDGEHGPSRHKTNVHKTSKMESPSRNSIRRADVNHRTMEGGSYSRNRQSRAQLVAASTESFAGLTRKRTPLNPHRRKQYEKQQVIFQKLEQEEAKAATKRGAKMEADHKKELEKQKNTRDHIARYVKMNRNQAFQFQKRYAVERAAEVIHLIETMAEQDANITTKNVLKKVLKNLIERNRDKGRDNQYWSMQLLIKLGLVADPGEEEASESFVAQMPADARARKLKEIGVFLPAEQLEQLNLELQVIAERNLRAMKSTDQVEEELAAKFSKKELKELRKLGFSNDDLLTMDINEAKPFKDHKLGHIAHVDQLMVKQKDFLEKLNELFKEEQLEEKRKDDLMAGVMADDPTSKKNEKWYFIEDPADMDEWPPKKKQDYERQKIEKLMEWYRLAKAGKKAGSQALEAFMANYSEGELGVFEDVVEKIHVSKKAAMFSTIVAQKKYDKAHPAATKVENSNTAQSSEEESLDEDDDDDLDDSASAQAQRGPPKTLVKASGVVFHLHIDPDNTSEDESTFGAAKSGKVKKNESTISQIERRMADPKAAAELKRKKDLEIAKKKEREKKLKEMNKNFNRKDKRETHKFLMKHGLTLDEAREYTTLGTEFDVRSLSKKDKQFLESNFQAQVYAFRKLRDRLLLNDNPAKLYEPMIEEQKEVLYSGKQKKQKAEAVMAKMAEKDGDKKQQMIQSAQQDMTEAQLKQIRRREYYSRRVKADFAPINADEELLDDTSPLSPEEKKTRQLKIEKIRKAKERKLKQQNEKPDWQPLYVDPNKPKQKYVKNSDKAIASQRNNLRSRSTIHAPGRLKIIQEDQNMIQSMDHAAQEVKLMLPNIPGRQNRNVSELGNQLYTQLNAGAKASINESKGPISNALTRDQSQNSKNS